jgi:hypothetical protein
VRGHVTVIWSASVERPCERDFPTAESILDAIAANDPEVRCGSGALVEWSVCPPRAPPMVMIAGLDPCCWRSNGSAD